MKKIAILFLAFFAFFSCDKQHEEQDDTSKQGSSVELKDLIGAWVNTAIKDSISGIGFCISDTDEGEIFIARTLNLAKRDSKHTGFRKYFGEIEEYAEDSVWLWQGYAMEAVYHCEITSPGNMICEGHSDTFPVKFSLDEDLLRFEANNEKWIYRKWNGRAFGVSVDLDLGIDITPSPCNCE